MDNRMERAISAFNTGIRELYPLFCGTEECHSGHSFGPKVRDYFLIHCVNSGKGVFVSGGREYTLTRGQCFIIRPGDITYYKADENDPWTYTWISFNGENAPLFAKRAGLYKTFVIENTEIFAIFENLRNLVLSGRLETENNEFSMLSVLYALFAALPRNSPTESPKELYIRRVKNYVGNMISNPISVEKIAADCGLERHYLCRIFKAQTGRTLQEYIIDCKMQKAKQLLLFTSLNVGDIGRSVGYSDVYNFSKMFKKHSGLSPLKTRKAHSNG